MSDAIKIPILKHSTVLGVNKSDNHKTNKRYATYVFRKYLVLVTVTIDLDNSGNFGICNK